MEWNPEAPRVWRARSSKCGLLAKLNLKPLWGSTRAVPEVLGRVGVVVSSRYASLCLLPDTLHLFLPLQHPWGRPRRSGLTYSPRTVTGGLSSVLRDLEVAEGGKPGTFSHRG